MERKHLSSVLHHEVTVRYPSVQLLRCHLARSSSHSKGLRELWVQLVVTESKSQPLVAYQVHQQDREFGRII